MSLFLGYTGVDTPTRCLTRSERLILRHRIGQGYEMRLFRPLFGLVYCPGKLGKIAIGRQAILTRQVRPEDNGERESASWCRTSGRMMVNIGFTVRGVEKLGKVRRCMSR